MSNLSARPVRRAAVGVLAGTLACTGAMVTTGLTPASAVEGFSFERLDGEDRYDTAVSIARQTFSAGAATALLARGDDFADALAGNYLAGVAQAPVLLTDTDELPGATRSGLEALQVTKVYILGGFAAVSAEVEAELRAEGYTVERLAGDDRYFTAELIAQEAAEEGAAAAVGEHDNLRTAILASGQRFPDALAAGGLSYAQQFPLLLTRPNDLPPQTADVLRELDIEQVIVVGGTTVISQGVRDEVRQTTGNPLIELSGSTRFETAREIADFAIDELGFTDDHVDLARADEPRGFADALAGGPHAGEERAPIVLTFPTDLPDATAAFLEARSTTLRDGHIFGGFAAVSAAVEDEAEELAAGDTPAPGDISVTPDTSQTLQAVTNPDSTTSDDRTYSVSGLTAGEEYRITLVKAGNVTTNDEGEAVFAEDADTGLAATGNPTADITTVNGAAAQNNTGDGTSRTTNPAGNSPSAVFTAGENGTASFTIDGDTAESVRPVVYRNGGSGNSADDGGSSPRLNLNDDGTAADESDIGGVTVFEQAADEAAAATVRPELVRAEIVETVTDEEAAANGSDAITANSVGTRVRFVFDEEITGTSQPVAENLFHVYDLDGDQFSGDTADEARPETGGNSVVVLFDDVRTDTSAGELTLATVDFGAVVDNENEQNPIGDAPLGESGSETVTFPAGVTEAPDLQSVGGYRPTTQDDDPTTPLVNEGNQFTTVTFTFDERAFVVEPAGFHLVTVDGVDIACTALPGAAGGDPDEAVTTQTADSTVDADCAEAEFGRDIVAADIARGYVDAGAVSDDNPDTTVVEGEGEANPLQASDTPDTGTSDPDLTSATLRPNTSQAPGTTDTVVYTFDEPVIVTDDTDSDAELPGDTDVDGAGGAGDFLVYDVDGNQVAATSVTRSTTDANTVIATFADRQIDRAVGASVQDAAVEGQTGASARTNEEDEVGVTNSRSETVTRTAGRTQDPDLTEVRVETNTSTNAAQAVYVFDEDLATDLQQPVAGELFLVQADGTRLVCTAATAGTTEDTDNTVTCTRFAVANANGTASELAATSAQVQASVVGTVDDDAVISDDAPATGQFADGQTAADFGNPEGASLVTGTTGSPQQ